MNRQTLSFINFISAEVHWGSAAGGNPAGVGGGPSVEATQGILDVAADY